MEKETSKTNNVYNEEINESTVVRYAGLLEDDFVNGQGVCVSFWTQGCPFRCKGCHNAQTWDFNGGTEIEVGALINKLDVALNKNGIVRNLSILGGEPLCEENLPLVTYILNWFKTKYPERHTFLWTGYTTQELLSKELGSTRFNTLISYVDLFVEGRFELDKRDVTLPYRGSSNQKVVAINPIYNKIATHRLGEIIG